MRQQSPTSVLRSFTLLGHIMHCPAGFATANERALFHRPLFLFHRFRPFSFFLSFLCSILPLPLRVFLFSFPGRNCPGGERGRKPKKKGTADVVRNQRGGSSERAGWLMLPWGYVGSNFDKCPDEEAWPSNGCRLKSKLTTPCARSNS